MRRSVLITLAAIAAVTLSMLPAAADKPAERDMVQILAQAHNRFVPKSPGTQEKLTYAFGPYFVPPGWDANRITLDLPVTNGFTTAVAPDLVDAIDGSIPTEQEVHIHHAHWLRVTTDPNHEYYATGLSWVFGTGEEKSQGRLDDRSNVSLDEPLYGIPIDGTTPQTLIYMLHNKTSTPLLMYVVLDVDFIHGSREDIHEELGRDIHPLTGTLWGETADATPDYPELSKTYKATADGTAVAAGSHLHPGGKYSVVANLGPDNPDLPGTQPLCGDADLDGDGWPGVTILKSHKFDRVPGAGVYSEDYQMGVTKFGWRAPIHKNDVIRQFAPYAIFPGADARDPLGRFASADGLPHAWYEAMTFTGMYVDRVAKPAALPEIPARHPDQTNAQRAAQLEGLKAELCVARHYESRLIGPDTFEAQGYSTNFPKADAFGRVPAGVAALRDRYIPDTFTTSGFREPQGMLNHLWVGTPDPLCGPGLGGACENRGDRTGPEKGRVSADRVTITGFGYVPGDLRMDVPIPTVAEGSSLEFVNADAFANIRHSITSCPAPCMGDYVSNFPLPDGRFDSGKIGNFDPIDGGFVDEDWMPFWTTPTDLSPGMYTYFCRIHPFMRGAFEVVPSGA